MLVPGRPFTFIGNNISTEQIKNVRVTGHDKNKRQSGMQNKGVNPTIKEFPFLK